MKNKWSLFNEGNLFIFQERERKLIKILKHYKLHALKYLKILDVGCGSGIELNNLIKFGANPKNLFGIDIRKEAIFSAKACNAKINYLIADGEYLPFKNSIFDIELQYTLFSSLSKDEQKRNIAEEMLRVLKNSGIIIWYDFFLKNPLNKEVKGIKRKEIEKLFKGCEYYFQRITLLPPFARLICPLSQFLCYFFDSLKLFNTHYMIGIKKRKKITEF